MSKPVLAVVGRPNVGKSTFFNRMAGKRLAIVEDTPGVTRDRIYAEAEWQGTEFAMIDTGGIEPSSKDVILSQMREQAQLAMDMADVILFMTDGKDGLTSADREVAAMLRRTGKPVILTVNKIDKGYSDDLYDFYELGLGEPYPISSVNILGFGELLDRITEEFPESSGEDEEDDLKIAVIGKPNVGKSSLINRILGENRVIVSPIAGTTRDSVDTPFEKDGRRYTLIDTAGIRRKSKVSENIERYSVIRAVAAIERCDVCVLMIDATEGITEQDKKIAGVAHEAGKGIIVAVNKWDLLDNKDGGTMNRFRKDIENEMQFMSYAPSVFISVMTGQRVDQIMSMAEKVAENCALRVPTGQLNNLIIDATMMKQPPSDKGRRLKIYYVTQMGVKPPLFAFQVNDRELMHFSYSRYLENKIREGYGFEGTSIKFVFREKGDNYNEY